VEVGPHSEAPRFDVRATTLPLALAIHETTTFPPLAPTAGNPRNPAALLAPQEVVPIVLVVHVLPSFVVLARRITPLSLFVHDNHASDPEAASTGKSTWPCSQLRRVGALQLVPSFGLLRTHTTRRDVGLVLM